jgi:pilus assembly protein FimV
MVEPEPEPEPVPPAPTAVEEPAVSPASEAAEEPFDMDDVFDNASMSDMVTDMPEATAADETASAMADEAAMDEMVAAAMEEGQVDAEDQFALDDVFGGETAATETEEPTSEKDMDMGDLADLLPSGDAMEEAEATTDKPASDDHSEALAAAFDETATKDLQDLDFGFDVDLGEVDETAPVTKAVPVAEKPAPTLDVKDLDLDVAGTGSVVATSSSEPAEVDTMLDLVTAYIDMSDEEGARELLKEILEKGGPEQKAKAQKLLDGLG